MCFEVWKIQLLFFHVNPYYILGTNVPNDMFGGVLKVIIGSGEMVKCSFWLRTSAVKQNWLVNQLFIKFQLTGFKCR